MHKGGLDPQAGEKCIEWVEKIEKKERKGKKKAKIEKIRLKLKEGLNRRKSSNLAKNRDNRLKIVSSYAKIETIGT